MRAHLQQWGHGCTEVCRNKGVIYNFSVAGRSVIYSALEKHTLYLPNAFFFTCWCFQATNFDIFHEISFQDIEWSMFFLFFFIPLIQFIKGHPLPGQHFEELHFNHVTAAALFVYISLSFAHLQNEIFNNSCSKSPKLSQTRWILSLPVNKHFQALQQIPNSILSLAILAHDYDLI